MNPTRLDALRPVPPVATQRTARPAGGSFQTRLDRPAEAGGPAPTAHQQALDLLAAQQASNLQYLALQHALSNPRTSVISNVMKVRHDTAKNAIGNIR